MRSLARADLFKFKHASSARDLFHYTSYGLALGIPAALLLGSPVSTIVDLAGGVAIPIHFHLGMRSVIVDYVHDVPVQRAALGALAAVTCVTVLGLTLFNIRDVGLTGAISELWTHQEVPAVLLEEGAAATGSKASHH